METMKKRRRRIAGDEQGSKILIKQEEEWLAEDSIPAGLAYEDFKLNKELLPSIKTKEDSFHAGSEGNAVQRFTPALQTDEYIKSELILDEEWIDNLNESETNCKQHVLVDPQLVGAGISVNKSETDKFCSASDSPKRLRNVAVRMLSTHLGKAQAITPCPPTTDGDSKKSNLFICEECGSSFTRKRNLKTHMLRKHFGKAQARFECEICSRSVTTRRALRNHLSVHSKDRRREFACDLCGKSYYDKSTLNSHKKIHTGDGYPCKVCGERFTLKQSLHTHMVRLLHFDRPQQYTPQSTNNDVSSMKTELISDDTVSHTEGAQPPALAGDNKQQTGVNTTVDSVTCEICHNFYPRELIKAHMRLTHNDETYKCEICSRSYTTKFSLNVHLRMHSKDSRPEFACDLCGKTFCHKSNFNSHKKIHSGNSYACKVCGHRFTNNSNLKKHMVRREHFDKLQHFKAQSSNNDVASIKTELISDEEFIDEGSGTELAGDNIPKTGFIAAVDSVTCEVCHNLYPSELIKTHMRYKHNDATYKCQFCSRCFKTKCNLKVHLSTHSKDRRREFACDLCEKTFYGKSELTKHKKIHTGDRYACKVCGDGFLKKESLKIHMLRRQHFDKTQQFTPQSSNNDVASMKTELITDEEFMDEEKGTASVSHAAETQQPARAADNKQLTGTNTAMDSVTCEVCHNNYPGELIKTHMRLAHNKRAYKCCSNVYWNKPAFEKHISEHNDNRRLPYACEQCGLKFVSKVYLKRHLVTHTKNTKHEFDCEVCKKKFYSKGGLKYHMNIHTGKSVSCEVCGAHFVHTQGLKKHMLRSHSSLSNSK